MQSLEKSNRITNTGKLKEKLKELMTWFSKEDVWITDGYVDYGRSIPSQPCGKKDFTADNGNIVPGSQTYLRNINESIRKTGAKFFPRGKKNQSRNFTKSGSFRFSPTSIPQDKYNSVSFRNRKPDLVAYQVGSMSGPYAITLIGDAKPFDGEDRHFADMQVGHILDMGMELMRFVQPWRSTLIVFLTNTRRWQFFEITRTKLDGFTVHVSAILLDAAGWSTYFALLSAPLERLGFESISIEGVEFLDLLGIGKKYLFSGRGAKLDDDVIVGSGKAAAEADKKATSKEVLHVFKVFPTADGFDRELQNLTILASCSILSSSNNVPRLVSSSLRTRERGFAVLAVSPLGLPVSPCERGERVTGPHIAQLIDVVQEVHRRTGLAHRDIKPANIFLTMDKELLVLNDWGSAAPIGVPVTYEGTFGFYDSPKDQAIQHTPSVEADLIALVRTSYLMLFNESPPSTSVVDVSSFWAEKFSTSDIWKDAIAACTDFDK